MKTIKYGLIISGIVVILIMIFGIELPFIASEETTAYQFAEIERGDIVNTISSTGSISPLTTVEVGTQISGTIAKVFADYNQEVKKGQLLAILDTTLLKANSIGAEADIEQAKARLKEAEDNYRRQKKLYDQNLLSASELLSAEVNLTNQQAALKNAEASQIRSQYDLENAYIRSPITGTVIERNIEEGQTVAASLSAPILFKIAEDLSKIEILGQVDESDIGAIQEGQQVNFEVAAYPEKIFEGVVQQVRLQPMTISNVVTYTTVIEADNEDGVLLPGMTAIIDFIIEQRKDVLRVPAAAPQFTPPPSVLAELRQQRSSVTPSSPDSTAGESDGFRRARMLANVDGVRTGAGPGGNSSMLNRNTERGRIWVQEGDGQLRPVPVQLGATDGTYTEIISLGNQDLEGVNVITGSSSASTESVLNNNQSRSPFVQSGPPRRRGF